MLYKYMLWFNFLLSRLEFRLKVWIIVITIPFISNVTFAILYFKFTYSGNNMYSVLFHRHIFHRHIFAYYIDMFSLIPIFFHLILINKLKHEFYIVMQSQVSTL